MCRQGLGMEVFFCFFFSKVGVGGGAGGRWSGPSLRTGFM